MILDSVIFPTNLSSELIVYNTFVQRRRIGARGFMISNLIFHHHTLTLALKVVAHSKQLIATQERQMTLFNSGVIANKVLITVIYPLSAVTACALLKPP